MQDNRDRQPSRLAHRCNKLAKSAQPAPPASQDPPAQPVNPAATANPESQDTEAVWDQPVQWAPPDQPVNPASQEVPESQANQVRTPPNLSANQDQRELQVNQVPPDQPAALMELPELQVLQDQPVQPDSQDTQAIQEVLDSQDSQVLRDFKAPQPPTAHAQADRAICSRTATQDNKPPLHNRHSSHNNSSHNRLKLSSLNTIQELAMPLVLLNISSSHRLRLQLSSQWPNSHNRLRLNSLTVTNPRLKLA